MREYPWFDFDQVDFVTSDTHFSHARISELAGRPYSTVEEMKNEYDTQVKELQEKVSKQAWDLWLKESVKYINTYRVDLSSREGTEFMLKQLRIWLGMDDGELAKTAWTPEEQAAIDAERNEEG